MSEHTTKLYFRLVFLALLLPLTSGDCINLDLGMESRSIPDGDITVSSVQSASTPAKNGRLKYTSGSSWCAGTSDPNPYLQIDLQRLHVICAVSTQGNSKADQWVKNYTLNSSTDGSSWKEYKENGQVKSFEGNNDSSSEVKHVLYEGILARYMRFLSETHHGSVCMRTEVFGVKQKPENIALGKPTSQSSTFNNTALGVSGVSAKAVDGNPDTEFRNGHCSHTTETDPSWWRVDLGTDLVAVSEIYIVNRFSTDANVQERNKDYEITLGGDSNVANNHKCIGQYSFIDFKASAVCFTNPLKTGRYVGIITTKSQSLQLCEVEVYSRENLAFNKKEGAAQCCGRTGDGKSAKAVDGNSNTDFMGGAPAGSCSMTDTSSNQPWWRVDLEQDVLVSEVYIVNRGAECDCGNRLGSFEIRVGPRSSVGGVTNPKCGDAHSVPIGEGASFFCHPSLKGSYVTIRNIKKARVPFTVCEVEVYSERRACPMQAIGVASRDAFPDSTFSSSSSSGSNVASNGRLNTVGAWSPFADNNANDYLQIDLQYEFVICAVATQGKSDADEWTTKYKLQLSLSNIAWVTYQENSVDKVFNGNSGRNDIVKHSLKEFASARFIRFLPTNCSTHKALRVEVFGILLSAVPSKAPSNFTLLPSSSTSIVASWQLPPMNGRHAIITGFKLFYKKKDSVVSFTMLPINNGTILTKDVTGLEKFTEYEFQVLAFTSVGVGPKSTVKVKFTKEDAPGALATLSHIYIPPSVSHGPRINLTWSAPVKANGVIRSYTVFYSHSEDPQDIHTETIGADVLSYSVDVFGGVTYQFHVRAVTTKPGVNSSFTEDIPEYKPSIGPKNVLSFKLNGTAFNISWAPLRREESNGKVTWYEINLEEGLSGGKRQKRSSPKSRTVNVTATFVVLYELLLCSRYHVSVRAYTEVGPGPYSQPLQFETSIPGTPWGLKATNPGTTQVTLEWKEPELNTKEGLNYTVKYFGTKTYNKNFQDERFKLADKSTTVTVTDLVPGSLYRFEVYGSSSACGNGIPTRLENDVNTKMTAPLAPVVLSFTSKNITESSIGIHLWPVEQRNGPISAYQVIVLKVADGGKELPDDYVSKLTNSNNANKDNLNFYVAAEIKNVPVHEKPWVFTVGDEKTFGAYINKGLEVGEVYFIYQRAVTDDNGRILEGEVSKVATISVVTQDVGATDKSEGSGSVSPVAIAVPVVLLVLIIPALIIAVFVYRRRKRSEKENNNRSRTPPVELDDITGETTDTIASTSNLVYQNVADIRLPEKDVVEASPPEEKELVYSEAEDGKPRPIPVAEFSKYVKNKSSNGAIVLKEEFQNLLGAMQFSWEIGKSSRVKNRYGNITSYDHSRVVLEKIEGEPMSDYVNASYIPTFDEKTMCYIATQGPTSVTISDFWRMIWQENCVTIVMLTNLVELGKAKCDQYWPDTTTKFGSITVTLHKTETFADYVIRTFMLVKESEKREVHQFHFVTWPDKGVPQHSGALLGFRYKIHARHQATGGPLVVHCSAGVGRTGTYIGIDAMLESAKEKKTVFIQNYVQVMRRYRPHMVQKPDQYVFLHQAVMEALMCGNTEIPPQDLRITMNKLARVHKPTKRTGYAQEFKRLKLVSECQSSGEESTAAFKPSNINKNRFPNIVPLDTSRVFLRSSDPEKDYINASFVDDYRERNAYILTQAPLDNTVEDFWRMISQYDIGTVVMLNSLKEGNESYPQYWPTEGSVKYGDVTVQILSENTSNSITTRRLSVLNAEPPKKKSTVQHLQFTGWTNRDSCPDPQEILDLLTAVQQSQQQTGNGVIVFQCSDGVGRSGCVSSIMSVIERVKTEQTVDVFQTIKLIRAKRAGAVDTLDRYEFCYKTIQAYLDSFSTYANFSNC